MNPHSPSSAGIFISYRREQLAPQAGRLYDRLSDRFGEDHVFMDVDSIALGHDFMEVIQDAVASCDILLAVIGNDWLDATDEGGVRRIDDPKDFVRLEIESALKRKIPVVPILINDAQLPSDDPLPASMRALTRRQALRINDSTFRSDSTRLIEQLAQVLEAEPTIEPRRTVRVTRSPPAAPSDIPDGGEPARPSAPDPSEWVVELVDSAKNSRTFDIRLTHSSHVLRITIGVIEHVVLDGVPVSSKFTMSDKPRRWDFSISDGEMTHLATCSLSGKGFNMIKELSLVIGRTLLYKEP